MLLLFVISWSRATPIAVPMRVHARALYANGGVLPQVGLLAGGVERVLFTKATQHARVRAAAESGGSYVNTLSLLQFNPTL